MAIWKSLPALGVTGLTAIACMASLPQVPAAIAGESVSRIRPADVAAEPAATVSRKPDDSTVLAITDHQFDQEVLKSAEPVAVLFWAPWCGPCRGLMYGNRTAGTAPVSTLEQLGQRLQGKVRILTINTDEHQQVARQLGIMAIPTMLFYRNGQWVDRIEGNGPFDYYLPRLEKLGSP